MPLLSDPKDAAFIYEMRRSLDEIAERIAGQDRDTFLVDLHKPHALAMSFLTLGEAANRISRGTWALHPHIEWQKIANPRHLIAHEYRRIDHSELWRIATEEAPLLADQLPELPSPGELF